MEEADLRDGLSNNHNSNFLPPWAEQLPNLLVMHHNRILYREHLYKLVRGIGHSSKGFSYTKEGGMLRCAFGLSNNVVGPGQTFGHIYI